MNAYSKLQVRVIKRYARFIHENEEAACLIWITLGLAKKFAIKHRKEFGMIKEII